MSAIRQMIHDQYKSAHAKIQFISICDDLQIPNLEKKK